MSSRVLPARLHASMQSGEVVEPQPFVWRQVGEPEATSAVSAGMATSSHPSPPADLERQLMEANARTQGVAADARREGIAQGRAEGEQRARAELTPLLERFARTIADLSTTRDAFRREAEEDVVRLSLGVARRVLHRELSIDPDALLSVVRVALGKFDARELHRVLVSTQDYPSIAAALDALKLPRRVEVIADPSLERGAALFETVKGTLDASVDTQLDEIERGFIDLLGKDGRRG